MEDNYLFFLYIHEGMFPDSGVVVGIASSEEEFVSMLREKKLDANYLEAIDKYLATGEQDDGMFGIWVDIWKEPVKHGLAFELNTKLEI